MQIHNERTARLQWNVARWQAEAILIPNMKNAPGAEFWKFAWEYTSEQLQATATKFDNNYIEQVKRDNPNLKKFLEQA